MTRWMTSTLMAALAVCVSAVTSGQAPAPPGKAPSGKPEAEAPAREEVPRKLEDQIAAALRSNPEVLRAEARALQAQAALNQARLRVTEEVVSMRHEMERLERMLHAAEASLDSTRKRFETGTAGREELVQAEVPLIEAKAKLQQAHARLRYLLGLDGDRALRAPEGKQPVGSAAPRARPAFSDKQKEILERKVSFPKGMPVHLEEFLQGLTGELMVVSRHPFELPQVFPPPEPREITLRAFLTLFADQNESKIAFVLRDYGILITSRSSAETMVAPVIPEDTPLKVE